MINLLSSGVKSLSAGCSLIRIHALANARSETTISIDCYGVALITLEGKDIKSNTLSPK